MAVSTAEEIEALRWEVRELRKEVARLRAAQEAASVSTHPAYQQPWQQSVTARTTTSAL